MTFELLFHVWGKVVLLCYTWVNYCALIDNLRLIDDVYSKRELRIQKTHQARLIKAVTLIKRLIFTTILSGGIYSHW